MLEKWRSYVRANQWWGFKAAPILGFTYLYFYFFEFSLTDKVIIFFLSATTIIGIAGFGYVINDFYDIEFDKRAGKKNPFEGKSRLFILLVGMILSALALLPWTILRSNIYIWLALSFQMILYFVYAHPIIRLKEKSIWGPVCDALYGHAIPIIIASLTYQQYLGSNIPYDELWFFITLFLWQFFKGIRNILLHQLEDYENDLSAGIQTLTTEKGKDTIYQKILFVIIPMEIVNLILFLISLHTFIPWTFVLIFVFLLLYIFGHGIFRNVKWHPKEYSDNAYIYFINDLYEVYFPYFFLIFCILDDSYAVGLLFLHIILFPSTINTITTDIRKALKEIWIQSDNFGSRIKRFLLKGV